MRGAIPWLAVAGSIAIIAGFNWYLGTNPPDISPIEDSTTLTMDNKSTQMEELDVKSFLLVQAKTRPLFEKTRRPWTAPLAQPETLAPDVAATQIEVPLPEMPTTQEPVDARLLGIQRSPGSTMVLITDGTGTVANWFKSGASFREWTIGEVTSNSVTLENAGKTFKLELYPSQTTDVAAP